jgi:hypothetical protein
MTSKLSVAFIACLVPLISVPARASVNLLVNGGFETGDFTGWTVSPPTDVPHFTMICPGGGPFCGKGSITAPEAGMFYVNSGPRTPGTISQTFSDIAGAAYNVDGWVASDGSTPTSNEFWSLSIDGVVFAAADPAVKQGWTLYTSSFVGTGSDTLTITSRNDFEGNYFDTFSVVAVPEPSSLVSAFTGLMMLQGLIWRSRKTRNQVTQTSKLQPV